MRYKMMGGIEQGIHYTTFQEDVEDENQQSVKAQEGISKSYDKKIQFGFVSPTSVDVNIKEGT